MTEPYLPVIPSAFHPSPFLQTGWPSGAPPWSWAVIPGGRSSGASSPSVRTPRASRRYSSRWHHLSCSASPEPGEPGPSSWTGRKSLLPRAATCPSALAHNRQAPDLLTQPIPEEGPGGAGAGIQAPVPRVSPLRPGLLWRLWLVPDRAWQGLAPAQAGGSHYQSQRGQRRWPKPASLGWLWEGSTEMGRTF